MQAEAQSKVDKKRDKLERKVLDSQERAFWDVHRPMVSPIIIFLQCNTEIYPNKYLPLILQPGCVNTTETDVKNACRSRKGVKSMGESSAHSQVELLSRQVALLKARLNRTTIKVSKLAEA